MQGETILCIAPRAWGSMWGSLQQYMSRIAQQNRVIFFPPGRNPEQPQLAEMYRNARYFVRPRAHAVNENLIFVPSPTSLPYARDRLPKSMVQRMAPLIARTNVAIVAHQIRWAVKEYSVEEPILWLYDPRHVGLAGRFNEKLLCYFITDEGADLPQNRYIARFIQDCDNALTTRADVVFGCSPEIVERRKSRNPESYCVLNAADFDLFHQALDPATPIPADIAQLPRPIVGVVGSLNNRLDVSLVRRVAEAYPRWSIVFVGPDRLLPSQSKSSLKELPNVHFLGRKSMETLPGYLKSLDVALIPYAIRPDTLVTYPLKLHEYLAAGRAIVSTAMPEVQRFRPVVRVADSDAEFIRMVGDASTDYDAKKIQARVALARQNTWDERLVEIYQALDRHLRLPKTRGEQRLAHNPLVG